MIIIKTCAILSLIITIIRFRKELIINLKDLRKIIDQFLKKHKKLINERITPWSRVVMNITNFFLLFLLTLSFVLNLYYSPNEYTELGLTLRFSAFFCLVFIMMYCFYKITPKSETKISFGSLISIKYTKR